MSCTQRLQFCGFPAKDFFCYIREFESISFDRGMYAGPSVSLGSTSADIIFAIKLGLLTKATDEFSGINNALPAKLSDYARVGGVPGSAVQGDWSETGYNLELCHLNLRRHRSL